MKSRFTQVADLHWHGAEPFSDHEKRMKMKVDAADVAKAGIFISALMLFFGFGNYYATVDLATSETEKQVAPWALLWLVVGVVGLPLLVLSMVQYRKVRRRSGGRLR